MSDFIEEDFVWALTSRPADTKRFAFTFKPNWLAKVELRPIVSEIYAFAKENGEPPSLSTLHKLFKNKDKEAYELRYKEVLEDIQRTTPDLSDMILATNQAKDVSIIRSFQEMINDPAFIEKIHDFDGKILLRNVHLWISKFANTKEDKTMNLKEAIENLIQESGWVPSNERIPCGIKCIDNWTAGGLRRKQLGIIIAPTGHGKTAVLTIMADKIASVEQKNVWFITNELPIEEATERFLSRLTGIKLDLIMDDPAIAYQGLSRHWRGGLDKRLLITECNREISVDDIESEMMKLTNLYGWKPDVIVLDYMERMKPALSGFKRDKEWQWIGAVASDIVRLNKRHNILTWSAAQTNREGFNTRDKMSLRSVQGSIRHLQEATAVVTMRQIEVPGEEDKIAMELQAQKMRQSKKPSAPVYVMCDLSKMNLTNEEIDMSYLEAQQQQEENSGSYGNEKPLSPREKQIKDQKKKRRS